jgi:hypothetical protein
MMQMQVHANIFVRCGRAHRLSCQVPTPPSARRCQPGRAITAVTRPATNIGRLSSEPSSMAASCREHNLESHCLSLPWSQHASSRPPCNMHTPQSPASRAPPQSAHTAEKLCQALPCVCILPLGQLPQLYQRSRPLSANRGGQAVFPINRTTSIGASCGEGVV